jgi:hypothetical protein
MSRQGAAHDAMAGQCPTDSAEHDQSSVLHDSPAASREIQTSMKVRMTTTIAAVVWTVTATLGVIRQRRLRQQLLRQRRLRQRSALFPVASAPG